MTRDVSLSAARAAGATRARPRPRPRARSATGDRVVMAKTRRRKRRTHADADAEGRATGKEIPKSLVFARGRLADAVRALRDDVRRVSIDRRARATARVGGGCGGCG